MPVLALAVLGVFISSVKASDGSPATVVSKIEAELQELRSTA